MKTTSTRMAHWMAALLCLGVASGAKAGDPASDPLPCHADQISCDTKSSEGKPAKSNRASGIVGMDVRNRNDEKLGRLKDVVFDLNTERVSYAVISTKPKGMFAFKAKLLAVPLNALTTSPDGKHLILNAEKSKVETAMGFDRNQWPSVTSPSWGAQPSWREEPGQPAMHDKTNEDPEVIADPEMDPELMEDGVKAVPSIPPALDDSPGGLAWPGW